VTKRGFVTAAEAARARCQALDGHEGLPKVRTSPATLTVDELLDHYLDGLAASRPLSSRVSIS